MEEVAVLVGVGAAPVITLLVELTKPFIKDGRFYAPLAVVIGIVWNVFVAWVISGANTPQEYGMFAILGILSGLAASGLYSAGRTIVNQGE